MIKSGIYSVHFTGGNGSGSSAIVFNNGKAVGVDTGGAIIEGTYKEDVETIEFDAKFTFREPAQLATSGQVVPAGFSFRVAFEVNPNDFLESVIRIETPQGPANAIFRYVAPIPE